MLKQERTHGKLPRFEYQRCKATPAPSMVEKSKLISTTRQNCGKFSFLSFVSRKITMYKWNVSIQVLDVIQKGLKIREYEDRILVTYLQACVQKLLCTKDSRHLMRFSELMLS